MKSSMLLQNNKPDKQVMNEEDKQNINIRRKQKQLENQRDTAKTGA